MAGGEGLKSGFEIVERVDVVAFAGLCRPPNYAELIGFPQHLS